MYCSQRNPSCTPHLTGLIGWAGTGSNTAFLRAFPVRATITLAISNKPLICSREKKTLLKSGRSRVGLSEVSLLRNECHAKRHRSNKLISLWNASQRCSESLPWRGRRHTHTARAWATIQAYHKEFTCRGEKAKLEHADNCFRENSLTVFLFISRENMINFFKWKKLFCSESLQTNTITFWG